MGDSLLAMAQSKEDPPATKPALSSRLMQMKFMQRGQEKAIIEEAVVEQVRQTPYIGATSRHVYSKWLRTARSTTAICCSAVDTAGMVPGCGSHLSLHAHLFMCYTQVRADEEDKWTADAQQTGCVVLTEADPPPGAYFGHMSFSSFNPELQKLQVSIHFVMMPFHWRHIRHTCSEIHPVSIRAE